jgi:chorismate--pyruvate lyase
MRAMIEDSHWLPQPPALPPALLGFVTEPGSLTERLLATGHRFAVQPLSRAVARPMPMNRPCWASPRTNSCMHVMCC